MLQRDTWIKTDWQIKPTILRRPFLCFKLVFLKRWQRFLLTKDKLNEKYIVDKVRYFFQKIHKS